MGESQRVKTWTRSFLFLPVVLVLALNGCVSTKAGALAREEARKKEAATVMAEKAAEQKVAAKSSGGILKTAFSQVGKRYRYGGSSPETGFDCSGFVKWVFSQHDINLPRSSGDMMGRGQVVERKELKPGDLVFFGRKKRITHVGIYTGQNKYIHSPRTGKSIEESPLEARARGEYYVGARRIMTNLNVNELDETLKQAWMAAREASDETSDSAAYDVQAPQQFNASESLSGDESASAALVAFESAVETQANGNVVKTEAAVFNAEAGQRLVVAEAKEEQPEKKHRVISGDTIFNLARKYEVTPEALAKANKYTGKETPLLKVGQVLLIPAKVTRAEVEVVIAAKTQPAVVVVEPLAVAKAEPQVTQVAPQVVKAESAVVKPAAQVANAAAQSVKTAEVKAAPQPVAKVEKTVVASKASSSKVAQHKVVSGDTLYSLSRKYGVSSDALAKANNFADKEKTVLKLGQMLVVPGQAAESKKVAQSASADSQETVVASNKATKAEGKSAQKSGSTKSAKSTSAKKQHTVASGDTLYDLARKYGVSPDALAKANNMDTKKLLKLGQVLVVPSKN